jgi:ParB family chromosome partitioning protein
MQDVERQRVALQIDEAQFGRSHLFLPIDQVRPNPRNPRKTFDDQALNTLADSLKQHGQLQPIVVRRTDDSYELIAGERRWRACQRAQLDRVWAVERHVRDEFEAAALGFIENAQRVDLSREEKVAALDDLAELVGSVGLRKLALEIKVAPSWLSEQLKVRRDPEIFPALEEGHISVAQAAALSRAPAHARRNLLDRTVREHPEFRIVRQWVDEVRRAEKASRAEIGASLALGESSRDKANVDEDPEKRSRFAETLELLRSAGAPTTEQDFQALATIREFCDQLLSAVPIASESSLLGRTALSTVASHQTGASERSAHSDGLRELIQPAISRRSLKTRVSKDRRTLKSPISA